MNMLVRKNIAILSVVAMLIGTLVVGGNRAYAASGDTIVYITKTGDCYHASGCSSLKKSKIETTLQSAIDRGYKACSKCHPGSLTASSSTSSANNATAATTVVNNTTVVNAITDAVEALKTYKGNNDEFNAYAYYINNIDLQTAIGPDGDKLLKHFNDSGKAEGRKAK